MVSRVLQRFAFPREKRYLILQKKKEEKKEHRVMGPCNVLRLPDTKELCVCVFEECIRIVFVRNCSYQNTLRVVTKSEKWRDDLMQ